MNAQQFSRLLQEPELLAQTDPEELLHLAGDYPWFGAAQVLSAVQLQHRNEERSAEQLQKALLYVQNPLWLQHIIRKHSSSNSEDLLPPIPNEDEDILHNAAVTVEAADTLVTTVDEDTDAALDAAAIVEAADSIITDVDVETEAAINAEAIVEASTEPVLEEFTPLSKVLKEPLMEGDIKLSFEPLHTVDYFASQGIKLKEELLQKDQLGKQLKTFTQWLKTMKKVYVEEHNELDAKAEKEVLLKAVESNTGEEIITETMASVLEQQGKTTKAIELYRKLSLLHPEKSAYFAAQIERLNK